MSSLCCNSTFWVSVSIVGGALWLLVTQIINYWWESEGSETENRDLGSYTSDLVLANRLRKTPPGLCLSTRLHIEEPPTSLCSLIRWMNKQTCIAAELNMVIWAGVKISARPEFRIWCGSRKQHFPFWYPKSGLTPTVALFLMPRSPVKARGTCRGYLGFRSVLWTASSENASEIMFFTAICDTWPLVCFCRLCAREKKAHLWLEGETQRGRIMLVFSFRIVFWVTA